MSGKIIYTSPKLNEVSKTLHENPLDARFRQHTGLESSCLQSWQFEKLRQLLMAVLQNSPFYKRKFAGLHQEDIAAIQKPKDLEMLPLTTPEELAESPNDFLCVSQDEIAGAMSLNTSGTTGPRKRIFFTAQDLEEVIDFFAHGMSTFVNANDRVVIFMPHGRPGGISDLLALGLQKIGVDTRIHGIIENPKDAFADLHDFKATFAVGMPIQALILARLAESVGKLGLKGLLFSGDLNASAVIKEIEEKFACPVYLNYGLTESGYGGAVECLYKNGAHVKPELLLEIVDPESGQILPLGTQGEIVITAITRQGAPLIRYRTRDISWIIPDKENSLCPCASFLPRIGHSLGRIENSLLLQNGKRLFGRDLDEAIFPFPSVLDYQAKFRTLSPQKIAEINLLLAPRPGCRDTQKDLMALKTTLEKLLPFYQITLKTDFRPPRPGVKRQIEVQ